MLANLHIYNKTTIASFQPVKWACALEHLHDRCPVVNVPLVVFLMSRVLSTCLWRQSVRSFTMDTLSSRMTSLHQKQSEDIMFMGYEQGEISFATRSVAALRMQQKNAGNLPGKPGSNHIWQVDLPIYPRREESRQTTASRKSISEIERLWGYGSWP